MRRALEVLAILAIGIALVLLVIFWR